MDAFILISSFFPNMWKSIKSVIVVLGNSLFIDNTLVRLGLLLSQSTSKTLYPFSLSVAPKDIAVVVFPTPPFWLHIAMILHSFIFLLFFSLHDILSPMFFAIKKARVIGLFHEGVIYLLEYVALSLAMVKGVFPI